MATKLGKAARCAWRRPQVLTPRAAPLNSTSPAASSQRPGLLTQPGLIIRLYPELSAAALRAKRHKEIALWYQLRALTTSDRIPVDSAIRCLVPHCYSQATFYRILGLGNGLFWDHHSYTWKHPKGVIIFHGKLKVAKSLEVTHISAPREIPASSFVTRGSLNALLYTSIHHPWGSKPRPPISRQTLEEITGVNRRTQRRYDKKAHTTRVPNYVVDQCANGKLRPRLALFIGKTRLYIKHRRLGNTYYAKATQASKGMLRRVNRLLAEGSLCRDKDSFIQRYFITPKSFKMAYNRHSEPLLLAPESQRLIRGRKEWIALTA